MLPLQSYRSQSLRAAVKERTGNSLQARRVCPEPAWDSGQVMRETAVWAPTTALKIVAACSLTCRMPPWESNNKHNIHKFYMPQTYQIQAVGHWCYSSMCITTIRYRQWDIGVTVLCASQLSDTAHLILLNFITCTILGEEYRSFSSSLCNLLRSPITSFLLGPNILLNTIFSNTYVNQPVL